MAWFSNKGQIIEIVLQALPLVGWAAVVTTIAAAVQKVQAVVQDWWLLGSIFVSSLLVIWLSQYLAKKRALNPELKVSSSGQGQEKLPLIEAESLSPAPSYGDDEAMREKIARVFQHGERASKRLQTVAEGLYYQLLQNENEERRIIERLARHLLSNPCHQDRTTLSQALTEKKESFLTLQEYLGKFFLSYYALVYWTHEIGREQFSGERVSSDQEYILWQEHHTLFLNDIRTLYKEGDFSALQKRIGEGQRNITG